MQKLEDLFVWNLPNGKEIMAQLVSETGNQYTFRYSFTHGEHWNDSIETVFASHSFEAATAVQAWFGQKVQEQIRAVVDCIKAAGKPLTSDEMAAYEMTERAKGKRPLMWLFCLNDMVQFGYLVRANKATRCSTVKFYVAE